MTEQQFREQAEKLIWFTANHFDDLEFADAAARWWESKDFMPEQQSMILAAAMEILEGRSECWAG